MAEKRLRLVPAGVGQTSSINWDWIGLNRVEPLQKAASGTPGGTGVTMFGGKGNGPTLTNGYSSGDEKGYVHMENSTQELFKAPNLNNGEASFRYYGFMNNNSYHYFMNWQLYNSGDYLYPAPLRGINLEVSVGADNGYTSWGCNSNWGDHTQINKAWGLFRNTSGSYRVWEMVNLIDDGVFNVSSIKNKSYTLRNVPVTSTNSKVNKYLNNGQTKVLGLGVPYTVSDYTLSSYRFCGFCISVCISNSAAQKRCHTFKLNKLTPLPLGMPATGAQSHGKMLLYGERVRYNTSFSGTPIKLRYLNTADN